MFSAIWPSVSFLSFAHCTYIHMYTLLLSLVTHCKKVGRTETLLLLSNEPTRDLKQSRHWGSKSRSRQRASVFRALWPKWLGALVGPQGAILRRKFLLEASLKSASWERSLIEITPLKWERWHCHFACLFFYTYTYICTRIMANPYVCLSSAWLVSAMWAHYLLPNRLFPRNRNP
jgi:hypothetical protein